MPNRAERRAQAKSNRRGVPQQYDQTQGRARSGMLDEYQLQEKSRRLQDGTDGPWKPSASTITETENVLNTNPDYKNPKMFKAPHSVRQWFRVASSVLIALSAIAFLVVMWLPSHPMWLISTVAIVFAVGVLSLFFTAGNPKHNPNLDQNGTAVDRKRWKAVRQPEAFVSPLFLSDSGMRYLTSTNRVIELLACVFQKKNGKLSEKR